ncbi:MAG: hypothetical protein AAFR61_02725 [Bacteroidota bacterium]
MSKKGEPTYDKLKKTLSDQEIAQSYVLRGTMTEEEKQAAEAEFKKLRLEKLKSMSDEQVLQGELVRMKLLIRDYLQQNTFLPAFSFASQLKQYIDLLKVPHGQFAQDIAIHKTKLSRLIHAKEAPNVDFMYRLEIHSGAMIPASFWYRLYAKQIEEEIKTNQEKRALASEKVKNELKFKPTIEG